MSGLKAEIVQPSAADSGCFQLSLLGSCPKEMRPQAAIRKVSLGGKIF